MQRAVDLSLIIFKTFKGWLDFSLNEVEKSSKIEFTNQFE